MASKSIFTSVLLLVVLCLFLMRESSDNIARNRCSRVFAADLKKNVQNRKLLTALKAGLNNGSSSISSSKYDEKSVSQELRKVPSGPDPLHHNGCCPKNPTTIP